MNYYQIKAFVNAKNKKYMTQTYDNTLAKDLASQMVGDGQSPNLWFVTYGPYVAVGNRYGDYDYELIDGFDKDKDVYTFGPLASFEVALSRYDEIELDQTVGIGQAYIEDRQCGMIKEKWLTKQTKIVYDQDERDDSHLFYNK